MRIAIVGSGISGLVAAHVLRRRHDVTLIEADGRPGGHSHSVRVDLADHTLFVDTGFLVYTERTYPGFVRLLDQLQVATRTGVEWRGTSPATVFAQPRNLARPAFLRMLADVGRFNRLALRLLDEPPAPEVTLGDLIEEGRWSRAFLDWYLVPLGSSIWSADPTTFTRMPAARFARFFERHGLLTPTRQPAWRTVTGGSHRYVDALLAPLRAEGRVRLGSPVGKIRSGDDGTEIWTDRGPEVFDHVVVATHSDQALSLLADPTPAEEAILGAVRYQPNRATLHTDDRLLPRAPRARASWNYHRLEADHEQATLTYRLNSLQSLPCPEEVLVTLNRDEAIDPEKVVASFDYAHPVLDPAATAAQARQGELFSPGRSFCGAWLGDGFHEDGVAAALAVCARFGERL